MLSSVALAPINHIILSESWAKRRLQSHVGKTVQLSILPFLNIVLTVKECGTLSTAPDNSNINATATFTLSILSRLLIHDEDAYSEISILGDNEFAEELIYIVRNTYWDIEQDLSRITGDIFAHRAVQTGKNIKYWHKETTKNLSEALMEYWLEEQPLLVKSSNTKEFFDEVNALWKEVEQLENRIKEIS